MKQIVTILTVAVAGIGLSFGAAGCAQTTQAPADLVLTNGVVLTVDPNKSVAEAVAITGGRIVAVGTSAQIKAHVGSATQIVDLAGRTVTPGLIDSHNHFSEANSLFGVDLSDTTITSMDDVKKRIAAKVATLKPGEWVSGFGWDEGKLAERRYITAADLDQVAPALGPCVRAVVRST